MKKTYIEPSTLCIHVETPNLMEISTTLGIYGDTANDTEKLLGRRHTNDIWDDEEEDF